MNEIRKLFEDNNITQKQLMFDLEVSQPFASALMNGRKSIGKSLARKLNELYGFDIDVLLQYVPPRYQLPRLGTKDGQVVIEQPLSDEKLEFNASKISDIAFPIKGNKKIIELGNGKWGLIVNLVPEYGYAGYISGWRDAEYLEDLPKHMVVVDHPPKGDYLAVEVVGDSMENWNDPELARQSIRDGEIVTGRNIPQHYWSSRFHIHKFKDFIIVHDEGILVKRIVAHDVEQGIITCHSLNPAYEDFDIHLSEVKQILNIIHPKR